MSTSVKKVTSSGAPTGQMGQTYLASGTSVALRLWEEGLTEGLDAHTRPYETVGYVLEGAAELHVDGQVVKLEPGDSWVVPADAERRYIIKEKFKAIEATSPPARVEGRDNADGKKG